MDCNFRDLPLIINFVIVPRNSGNRANPENDSPSEITHKKKSSQPNLMILVLVYNGEKILYPTS